MKQSIIQDTNRILVGLSQILSNDLSSRACVWLWLVLQNFCKQHFTISCYCYIWSQSKSEKFSPARCLLVRPIVQQRRKQKMIRPVTLVVNENPSPSVENGGAVVSPFSQGGIKISFYLKISFCFNNYAKIQNSLANRYCSQIFDSIINGCRN